MSEDLSDIQIVMSPAERALLQRRLERKPVYLEFGCGGSTELAAAMGCPMIVSVDSDQNWLRRVAERPRIAPRLRDGTINLRHVDIGPLAGWGAPADDSRIRNWPKYCLSPFGIGFNYQFILVDGRFRTACAYVAWAFMDENAVLGVHDYSVRAQYFGIEKFFEVVDEAGSLALFRKKPRVVQQSYVISLLGSLFDA